MTQFSISNHPPVTFSPLRREDTQGGVTVTVCIYQIGTSGWTLRILNNHGLAATWQKTFATDQDALDEYEKLVRASGIQGVISQTSVLMGIDGFNPDLLAPQDQRYRGDSYKEFFTLRKFELIKKYGGRWPIHNIYGHIITGYLYRNAAPAWPHPAQQFPGAPDNIEIEFSIPSQHIESYVQEERRLKKASSANYWQR